MLCEIACIVNLMLWYETLIAYAPLKFTSGILFCPVKNILHVNNIIKIPVNTTRLCYDYMY